MADNDRERERVRVCVCANVTNKRRVEGGGRQADNDRECVCVREYNKQADRSESGGKTKRERHTHIDGLRERHTVT